jgi:hypothetical protein
LEQLVAREGVENSAVPRFQCDFGAFQNVPLGGLHDIFLNSAKPGRKSPLQAYMFTQVFPGNLVAPAGELERKYRKYPFPSGENGVVRNL